MINRCENCNHSNSYFEPTCAKHVSIEPVVFA